MGTKTCTPGLIVTPFTTHSSLQRRSVLLRIEVYTYINHYAGLSCYYKCVILTSKTDYSGTSNGGLSYVNKDTVCMWDMSALIQRCENFGHFYNFCSQLVHVIEYRRRTFVVSSHINFSMNIVFNDCCLC